MVALPELSEPIRLIANSDATSITAASILLSTFHQQDKRCSLRVVTHYTTAVLDSLLYEEYPSFVFLNCTEQAYHEKFAARHAIFLDAYNAYSAACSLSEHARTLAYLLVAGCIARFLETGELEVFDDALTDALKGRQLVADHALSMTEVDKQFFSILSIRGGHEPRRLFDFAEMLNACARTGKAHFAIASMLGDAPARELVVKTWHDYRRDLDRAFEWYDQTKTHNVVLGNGAIIVNMRDSCAPLLAGALAARLIRQAELEEHTLVLVLVYSPDNTIRVSLRMVGRRHDISLVALLRRVFEGVNGECGGTVAAAGGAFARADEERFLAAAQKVLEQAFVEEAVPR